MGLGRNGRSAKRLAATDLARSRYFVDDTSDVSSDAVKPDVCDGQSTCVDDTRASGKPAAAAAPELRRAKVRAPAAAMRLLEARVARSAHATLAPVAAGRCGCGAAQHGTAAVCSVIRRPECRPPCCRCADADRAPPDLRWSASTARPGAAARIAGSVARAIAQ